MADFGINNFTLLRIVLLHEPKGGGVPAFRRALPTNTFKLLRQRQALMESVDKIEHRVALCASPSASMHRSAWRRYRGKAAVRLLPAIQHYLVRMLHVQGSLVGQYPRHVFAM
jgi:hypothetical protein